MGYVLPMIRMIDRLGDWVASYCTPKVQRRIGVMMCLLSLPLFVFGFFVDEPFLVYQMSAGALLFGGLSTVVAAVPSQEKPGKRRPRHACSDPAPLSRRRKKRGAATLRRRQQTI